MGRRRLGQLAAAVVLASGIVVVGAPRASAATALEVRAGFDGTYAPGRAVRVRIAIVADRLVRGALDVRVTLGPSVVVTRPVEVPGGSTKELVVAVPTFGANFGGTELQVEVALRDGSGELAQGSGRVQWTPDAELVGVLPAAGALATVPDTTALAVDAGTARFVAVDELDLAEPGAIDAFDMLAVTPGELGSLAPEARSNVLAWLGDGGRLVVVGTQGQPVVGLPEAWQPGARRRAAASGGEVTWAAGTAANWFRSLEPTPTRSALDDGGFGRPFGLVPVTAALARDAGVRAARVSWLVGFLLAYVVIVGPVSYLVLRRLGRPLLLWGVVPALAAVFTAGGWLAGRSLRSGADAAHTTIVETRAAGARATSWVGVASRSGGGVTVPFPDGWSGNAPATFFGGFSDTSVRFASDGRAATGKLDLAAGGFATVSATGGSSLTDGLEVTASSSSDGQVDGTVRNTSPYALDDVRVFVGSAQVKVGAVGPGEEKPYSIVGASAPAALDGAPHDAWDVFDPSTGVFGGSTTVNSGAWDELAMARGANWANGSVVHAAGWTRAAPAPVRVRGRSPAGRTALVGEARVRAAGAQLSDRAIERAIVRGPGGVTGPPTGSTVFSFTLPDGAPAEGLHVSRGAGVTSVSVWQGGEWRRLEAGTAPTLVVPAAAFVDGRAYLRVLADAGPGGPADAFVTGSVP